MLLFQEVALIPDKSTQNPHCSIFHGQTVVLNPGQLLSFMLLTGAKWDRQVD
jgi:hypothetical protein